MPTDADPIVGNWYKNLEAGTVFEVVALDEDGGTVELQYYEGEVEELDIDAWYELVLEPAEPPEDWSAPYDDLDRDDIGDTDTAIHPRRWSGLLDDFDKED